MSPIQKREWYANARETTGLTVEEWETAMGLPPYSVCPGARNARTPGQEGYFMYTPAARVEIEAEENRQMTCLLSLGMKYREVAEIFTMHYSTLYRRCPGLGSREGQG